jgi:hypothetical protein
MKGTYFDQLNPDAMGEIFEATCGRCSDDADVAMLFEFLPLGKINSVPNGTAAFYRRPFNNMGGLIYWTEDSPEKTAFARETCHLLTKLLRESQPEVCRELTAYGNIGQSFADYSRERNGV